MYWKLVVIFLSLYPLLGQTCSCAFFPDRSETLRYGLCDNANVYSAVVVSATCTCAADTNECRTYSYSESNQSYSADIITASDCLYNPEFIKTCMQAEVLLAPGKCFDLLLLCISYFIRLCNAGVTLQTGSGPDMVINGTLPDGRCRPVVCPSNNESSPDYFEYPHVCMYKVRITEVFKGKYSVSTQALLLIVFHWCAAT